MTDEEGDVETAPLGRKEISTSGLYWAAAFLFAWHALSFGWIGAGGTLWKGYIDEQVHANNRWDKTPFSSSGENEGFEINFPFFAQAGQELVIQYSLDSDWAGAGAHPARITVLCSYCSATNFRSANIKRAGKSEIVFIVPKSWAYLIKISQVANTDGSTSKGTYWWGIRSPRKSNPSDI